MAGVEREANQDAYNLLNKTRAGVLVGSGMGGLTGSALERARRSAPIGSACCADAVFQDGVKSLVEKGYKKITPFFIPYAITNMGDALLPRFTWTARTQC